MTHRVLLISVLSGLFLVWGVSPAFGGSGNEPETRMESVSLFGLELCLPDALPDQKCDVRLPDAEGDVQPHPALVLSVPAEPVTRPQPDWVLHVFGLNVCLGDRRPGVACDLRIPPLLPDLDSPMMQVVR